jgi:hypothetical protein
LSEQLEAPGIVHGDGMVFENFVGLHDQPGMGAVVTCNAVKGHTPKVLVQNTSGCAADAVPQGNEPAGH